MALWSKIQRYGTKYNDMSEGDMEKTIQKKGDIGKIDME